MVGRAVVVLGLPVVDVLVVMVVGWMVGSVCVTTDPVPVGLEEPVTERTK